MTTSPAHADGYVSDVAYLPGYYPFMAPARIRYVAALNGVRPPAGGPGLRFLELGCGFGTTLLALAASNPAGEFTGVDFLPAHVEHMRREVAATGLGNVRVLGTDFAHLPTDLGQFDIIALHGVFSWVSPETRESIFGILRRHLAPGGIAEVTYNCMPGWASLLPVRSLIRHFAARVEGDSLARVRAALAEVAALRAADIPLFHDQPLAAQLVDRLLKADPHYVAHEYLNEHWAAFDAADVIGMFAGLGLGHAGRATYHHNHVPLCSPPQFGPQFAGLDLAATETLKDFHINAMFRWDLFSATPRETWSPAERVAAAPDLHFRKAIRNATLPHTVKYGAVTAGLAGPPHEELLGLIGNRGWTFTDLFAAAELAAFPPADIVEAIDLGVATGLLRVEGGPVIDPIPPLESIAPGSLDIPLPFNRRALVRENLANEQVALASTLTGAAHEIGDLHAAILDELTTGGSDRLPLRLADRLIAADKHLREHTTGRPITDRGELVHACQEICGEFLATVLPELLRQGIVVRLED
ncbi:MAG: methyltransferase domain-containing protein [Planctomycetia bacterium]|nr:methyltransferase domain-containing protein [Planctomycetia bacterium]